MLATTNLANELYSERSWGVPPMHPLLHPIDIGSSAFRAVPVVLGCRWSTGCHACQRDLMDGSHIFCRFGLFGYVEFVSCFGWHFFERL